MLPHHSLLLPWQRSKCRLGMVQTTKLKVYEKRAWRHVVKSIRTISLTNSRLQHFTIRQTCLTSSYTHILIVFQRNKFFNGKVLTPIIWTNQPFLWAMSNLRSTASPRHRLLCRQAERVSALSLSNMQKRNRTFSKGIDKWGCSFVNTTPHTYDKSFFQSDKPTFCFCWPNCLYSILQTQLQYDTFRVHKEVQIEFPKDRETYLLYPMK